MLKTICKYCFIEGWPNLPPLRKEATENILVTMLALFPWPTPLVFELNVSLCLPASTFHYCVLVSTSICSQSHTVPPHSVLFFHSLLPSVSLVIATIPQSEDTLQTFRPNGRQLIVHIKAKLRVLLWQTEEQ